MSVDLRRFTAVMLAAFVLLGTGAVVADSLSHQATEGVTYTTNSDVAVTLGDDREISSVPFDDAETFADGELTVSGSDAELTASDDTFEDDEELILEAVDVDGQLTVERDDLERHATVEDGDAALLQVRDYELDNDEEDLAYASDDGVTITLDGFEPVGIAAVDADTGEPLDETSAGQNGEATIELPAGQRAVELEGAPSELEVRNEAEPDELIDEENVTLRARLFADDDVVIEREVTDGTVSLEGVPLDEELVVTVKEENADFTYRRILLDSAIQSSEIYLLPTSEPSAEVRFQLDDQTDRFPNDETRFFVEKPITRDGETEYRIIAGDRIGADGEFPVVLVDEERYRLRVVNDDGEQRVLGSYTIQGSDIASLPIGEVEFGQDLDDGAAMQASLQDADANAAHNHEVRVTYVDPNGETESIEIAVEDSSGEEIRPTTTEQISGDGPYSETFPIDDPSFDPEEDTATVTVEADHGIETETFEEVLGDIPEIFEDVPINPQLLELMALGSILAVFGFLVIFNPAMAALVGTGYAGLLTVVGIAPIPMPAVVLAGVVGILATIGNVGGFR